MPEKEVVTLSLVEAFNKLTDCFQKLYDIYSANFPSKDSEDGFTGSLIKLNDGEEATITLDVHSGWRFNVKRIQIDFRDDTDYLIQFTTNRYTDSNELRFAKPIVESNKITIKITNLSGETQEYGFYVKGWGDREK